MHKRKLPLFACVRKPWWNRKIVRPQKFRIEQFGAVARAVITEHGHNHMSGPEIARKADRACDIDTA